MRTLFTIGYATKPIEVFIEQLQRYQVTALADVRSVPYSKAFHDYHQEALKARLEQAGIRYVYLGNELGPRSKDPAHYDECGQVQFEQLMQTPLFQRGINRLCTGLDKGYTIALMCAEKDPATCHRSLLIAYYLQHAGDWSIEHIQYDGGLESQTTLEARLREIHGAGDDLFASAEEQAQRAYQLQLKKIAYIRPESPSDGSSGV